MIRLGEKYRKEYAMFKSKFYKTGLKIFSIVLISMTITIFCLIYGAWVGMVTNSGYSILRCKVYLKSLEEARKYGDLVLAEYIETQLNVSLTQYAFYLEARKYTIQIITRLWTYNLPNGNDVNEIIRKVIIYREKYPDNRVNSEVLNEIFLMLNKK